MVGLLLSLCYCCCSVVSHLTEVAGTGSVCKVKLLVAGGRWYWVAAVVNILA